MRKIVFGWLLLLAGSCLAQCPGETATIVDSGYFCPGDTLAVYDRWGERVFEARDAAAGDPAFGWNGQEHGVPAPAGTYVYILLVRLPDGRQEMFKGTVLLIR